ncbi:tetratricopeptide repeat protein [Cytophaga aurantiaca]|uniref:type IX secretion system periplasmic lipoprotein PorW/SprE n=1 Tax=Cytophaga aurantiaca TaxID=29530 RepID=UPI000377FCB6|nr:tetratricopeptide repeat protein [Cytophaga aurantiaca]
MNTNKHLVSIPFTFFLLLLAVGVTSVSCSQESNSFVARTYHNLLARDNAFFLARERMKLVEVKVYDLKEDNYNVILHPIPPLDTNKTKGLSAQLDDIIKKASIPIRRHKNSDYVDDSYILVGRCRMYKGQFKMGMDTYKYMNANGKDDDDKTEGLIYLMRAYIAAGQYDNAKTVCDHIEKQKELSVKNKALFNVTKAEYLRIYERYDEMIPLLEEAAPLQKKRDIRSRMYFILGQTYQLNGNDTSAYKNYHKVVKSNPPYEMLFMARLNLYQVSNVNDESSKAKLNKYYTKLLKDPKNEEYKDKIYYEMAVFEYKQQNKSKAIEYLKKSSQASKSGGVQKGFTYLKLAEIYYDDLEDYENAAAYYDSTAATFNKKDKRYPLISKREKILDEFVKHINTIKRQDSLLAVAKLDTLSLNKLIDTIIAREQAAYQAKQLALKKQKENAANAAANAANTPVGAIANGDPSAVSWYFSNATAVKDGQIEFTRKWGDRKLQDHWRRSKKEAVIDFDADAPKDTTKSKGNPDKIAEREKSDITTLKIDRKKYLTDIPYTDKQKAEANKKIEDALFQVANIYNHKLDETDRAIRTYNKLLERYPKTEYEPEVLYNLYLIYKEKKDTKKVEYYKDLLFTKHPNSIYSKLIRNPNYYRDTKIANKNAEADYRNVYDLYKSNKFFTADSVASSIMAKYPDSDILDKLAYIKILCTVKTGKPAEQTQEEIKIFTEQFPESKLLPLVEDLSKAIGQKGVIPVKDPEASEAQQDKASPLPADATEITPPDSNQAEPPSLEQK